MNSGRTVFSQLIALCLTKNPSAPNGLILQPDIFIVMTLFVAPHLSSPARNSDLHRDNDKWPDQYEAGGTGGRESDLRKAHNGQK